MILLNQMFPCFHFFSKITPSHLQTICHKSLICGRFKRIVTKLSHVPVFYFWKYGIKKYPNLEKRKDIYLPEINI